MNVKKIFSIIFFLFIAAGGAFYYFGHRQDFHLITKVSTSALIAMSFIFILTSLCYGLQLKVLLNHYKVNISFLQCYGLSRAGSFLNLFLPFGGGASLKAIYLKKIHKLNYSAFIASMGITNIFRLLIYGLLAFLLLVSAGKDMNMFLVSISGLIFLSSLLFLFKGHKLKKFDITPSGYIKSVAAEWENIKRDRTTICKLINLILIVFVMSGLNIYLSFQAFSVNISASASGSIIAFSTITGLLNIIPGNFGIREAIVILISNIHGVGVNESVHAAALGRLMQIIWTFILAFFFKYNISRKTDHIQHMNSSQSRESAGD